MAAVAQGRADNSQTKKKAVLVERKVSGIEIIGLLPNWMLIAEIDEVRNKVKCLDWMLFDNNSASKQETTGGRVGLPGEDRGPMFEQVSLSCAWHIRRYGS